ncbi:MAG: RNA polymerase sigma factor [Sandaracinaceae bacterium]
MAVATERRVEPEEHLVPPPFEEVYANHVGYLWRSARGLGIPPAAIEDVLQDVFVVVHRRLPEFRGERGLRSWLTRILINIVREHQRRFRRKEDHAALPEELSDGGAASPHDAVLKTQAAAMLASILDAMPEDQREVFVLAEIEQVPVPEIADALELGRNTVYSRLRLARAEYQRHLARLRARDVWRLK